MNSTYTINFNDMKFLHGDYIKSDDMSELIIENDGYIKKDCQYMTFDYLGIEVSVGFEMSVSGRYSSDPGDYWTPPSSDCDIEDIEIDIVDLTIDEYDVELTKEITDILEELIKKTI